MQKFTMDATSRVARMLMYMHHTRKYSLDAGEAAVAMSCDRKQVPSLCARMVRKGFLRMEWHGDGQHYVWPARLALVTDGYDLTVSIPSESESEPEAEPDWCDEFLKVQHSWVKADGLPPPFTTGVRSVFDLGGSLR